MNKRSSIQGKPNVTPIKPILFHIDFTFSLFFFTFFFLKNKQKKKHFYIQFEVILVYQLSIFNKDLMTHDFTSSNNNEKEMSGIAGILNKRKLGLVG
jgi:hypothetical protein